MTKPSRLPDWEKQAAKVRAASLGCGVGGEEAFGHFTDLLNLLFCMTIGHPDASLHLANKQGGREMVRLLRGGRSQDAYPVVRLAGLPEIGGTRGAQKVFASR
jgi:hypothetical protein